MVEKCNQSVYQEEERAHLIELSFVKSLLLERLSPNPPHKMLRSIFSLLLATFTLFFITSTRDAPASSKVGIKTPNGSPAESYNLPYIPCDIHSFNLKDRPQYTALSYTWGNYIPDRTITISNKRMKITPNLYAFPLSPELQR